MHLFAAMLLLHTPTSTSPASEASDDDAVKKSTAHKTNQKFNLSEYLKDKLLEPNMKQIYGMCIEMVIGVV